jgi:UDP-glucose 4-epimerase
MLELPAEPRLLNVGSGEGASLSRLVELVEGLTGRQAPIDRRPDRPFDVKEIVLDVSRLRSLLDFEPTPLEEGTRRTYEALLEDDSGPAVAG